jgi:hypothetical protein
MSVSTIVAALAPSYAADSRIGIFTTLATQQTSSSHFGENYELAIALRVCHMIARNPSVEPGSAGAITSKSEGDLSVSYQVSSELQRKYGDLCSTPYGSQLADLIEGNVLGQMVASNGSFTAAEQGDNI